MSSINFIYASTSGHTEHVVSTIVPYLEGKDPSLSIRSIRCEQATPVDLTTADFVVLGSGSWNTGGIEGQMNPHMHVYLLKQCKAVDLGEKQCGIITLGDDRYFYTARAGEHMRNFIQSHNGSVAGQPLTIINDPYGQEERMHKWADHFLDTIS